MSHLRMAIIAAMAVFCAHARAQQAGGEFESAIDAARARVAKIYGGSMGTARGYASGVIVSPDGLIVTTLSALLESPAVRAVLPDGRRLPVRIVARDSDRQLALLAVEASELPYFELTSSADLEQGQWLIAAANPFKVADGPEWISVAVGVFAGRAELAALRRTQDFPYSGQVLLTDIIVTAPGADGGALVDASGRLVGVIGKRVTSLRTNTWLNYAMPVEEVALFVRSASDPAAVRTPDETPGAAAPGPLDFGFRLFDVGGRTRPAYVERVRSGSAADAAGLKAGDLIVAVNDQTVGGCDEARARLAGTRESEEVVLVVKRGEELRTIKLAPVERLK